MWIGGDEIVRAGVDVGEIASSPAGDGNFLADAFRVLEHHHSPAALSSFNRAKETCCSAADHYDICLIHCQIANCRLHSVANKFAELREMGRLTLQMSA